MSFSKLGSETVGIWPEQKPTNPLKGFVYLLVSLTLLLFAHFIDGFVEGFDDMETIQTGSALGQ